ncbi:cholesterol esterase [Myotisia sp. PD_48]|nr:cholesterol esterase [Myotisia sp. PD_48]
MPRVPFLGRLLWTEYLALFASLTLVFLEGIIHLITFCLPQPIINVCYRQSKKLYNVLSGPSKRPKQETISNSIANASDFVELCALFGYEAEEHIVQTKDGYLLGLHRLPLRKGEASAYTKDGRQARRKPVVYLHHGLLMNSEVWVCTTEERRCLAFRLVELGYDVWFGNNRGNKYSKKSTEYSPSGTGFWNFSMDQFAFYDIPDSIDYILSVTHQPALSYIGFSQGTAQAFATLSIHPALNPKVDVFIALAPAMAPAGLSNGVVDALVKASPDVMFLTFGRRSILSSTPMWQAILYPPIFVRIIDFALSFLFNWSGMNINLTQKIAGYAHLYSTTSTKSVVHWFQIIRNKSFQMYDDVAAPMVRVTAKSRYYKPAKFPTKNIRTPIVLVYGGCDSLIDIGAMLKELPRHTTSFEISHYEHLDFLWAKDTDRLVFPHVFKALKQYSPAATRELSEQVSAAMAAVPCLEDDSDGPIVMMDGPTHGLAIGESPVMIQQETEGKWDGY